MRVAAIYDIHANLPALKAVMDGIRQAGVDQLVVGGDVLPGPMPRETISYLQQLDIPAHFIQGNGDREVLALSPRAKQQMSSVPEQFLPILRWTAQQLHSEDEEFVRGWPETLRLDIRGLGEVLFCHATPRSDTEVFTRLTPEESLFPLFEGLNVATLVCGHTHMQFDRTIGSTRVLNAGSVGMPFGKPGAYWLLLGPEIQFRHTAYDLAKAAEHIRDTNYPQAAEFAAHNVLQPPSEEEILKAFSRVEVKGSP
jgi:putative phosphoesterase